MFDIGSLEFFLVCIVGILVLGPEKLPRAIHTLSVATRNIRGKFYEFQEEIDKEVQYSNIRNNFTEDVLGQSKSMSATIGKQKSANTEQIDTPNNDNSHPG